MIEASEIRLPACVLSLNGCCDDAVRNEMRDA